ncbi:MAG: hypothetical protein JSS95_04230 [Acidobacteria bacterium]|nr:hypothetical protein [Acidobacteriota bacterium]
MFLKLAIVLFLLWLGIVLTVKMAVFLVHLLLVFTVVALVMHVISGRRAV